jgi:NAD(P)-dependent dehydrogenase (short-subunit alcohol dehydrogenase family)
MPMRSTGSRLPKVVVVTGASAGIGRATAIAFARRGWRVALLARGRAGLDGARHDVEAAGGRALPIQLDVADTAALSAATAAIIGQWGQIDAWVNNAMLTVVGPADMVTPEEWDRVTSVTYLGAVHGTLAALRHMRQRDEGVIVQVGSALAYRSIPLQAPYCGAKAALRGFTDALRCELVHDRSNVKLSMVHLPGVDTPQFDWSRSHLGRRHRPVGAVYAPEAAAAAIVKAALHAPRELWVGAPVVQAILGTMIAPGFLDRYVARTAYEPQVAEIAAAPGDDILDAPAKTDHGMHGRFGSQAHARGRALDPGTLRSVIAGLAAGVVAGCWWGVRGASSLRRRGTPRR